MTRPWMHAAEYAALRTAIGGIALLPPSFARRAGAALGRLGYRPLGIRRDVVERQIAAAFPERSPAEVRALARASYENLGIVSVETALMGRAGPAELLAQFESTHGWDVIDRVTSAGRGVVVVTGHLGNWELGGAYLAARGLPLDAITRRMSNPFFDRYLTATRSRFGLILVPDAEAVRHTSRAIRAGRAVGFVADQGVRGLASTFVPFFGRPAKTPRGPAVFAIRLGAPVIYAAAIRQPSGRYLMYVEEVPVPSSGDREADVDGLVARYTAVLERLVRRTPEQYFWHHRRWRRQPPGAPPDIAEAPLPR